MTKAKFLANVQQRLIDLGHTPVDWVKGRWGFHTRCSDCGAYAGVVVSTNMVREFPSDTCEARRKSIAESAAPLKRGTLAHLELLKEPNSFEDFYRRTGKHQGGAMKPDTTVDDWLTERAHTLWFTWNCLCCNNVIWIDRKVFSK